MKGGLGNQLFQYALYRQLLSMGREVKMDDETGFREDKQRDPALGVLGLRYERASEAEIVRITDAYMDMKSRIRRKLTGRRTKRYDERGGNFDPYVLETDEAYLVGYWQSERFFPDPAVRERLKADILRGMEELLQGKERAVSLHIRRGDYLQPGTVETFGGICTEAYYAAAIRRVLEACPDAQFYVFSNDPAYVQECIQQQTGWFLHLTPAERDDLGGRFHPVRDALQDAAELYLMSRCRHHILANSSFSWWGAWLGEQGSDVMTIAPARWLNNKRMDDIYTEAMLRL